MKFNHDNNIHNENQYKILKVKVTEGEDTYISELVAKENISKQQLIHTRLFDSPSRSKEHFDMFARRSPHFYNLVNKIHDEQLQQQLRMLWHQIEKSLEE